jgi:MFS family permease
VPAYLAIWAVVGLAMAATFYEPAFATVTRWFHHQRGRALLVLTIAGGLASTIFLPLTGLLADRLGWRDALLVLAAVLAVGTIPPHALVLRRRPEDLGLAVDGDPPTPAPAGPEAGPSAVAADPAAGDVLRLPAFWWLTAAFTLSTVATVAVTVHLLGFLAERDYGPGLAALVAGAYGLFSVAGRVLLTVGGRGLPSGLLPGVVFGAKGVALLALLLVPGPAGVVAFLVLFGAGSGAQTLVQATMVADSFGRTSYGAISGMIALVTTLARAGAPVAAGLAYGALGGYGPVFWALFGFAAAATVSVVVAGRARPPARPVLA